MKRLIYKSYIQKVANWYKYPRILIIGFSVGLLLVAILRAVFSREAGLVISFTGFWGPLNLFLNNVIFHHESGFIPTAGHVMLHRIVLNASHTIVVCVLLAIIVFVVATVLRKTLFSLALRKYSVLWNGNPFKDSEKMSDKLIYKNYRVYDALCNADNKLLTAFIEYTSYMNEMLNAGFKYGQKLNSNSAVRLKQLEKLVMQIINDEKLLFWEWLRPNFDKNGAFHPRNSSLFVKAKRRIEKEYSREDSAELSETLHDGADMFVNKSFFLELNAFEELLASGNMEQVDEFILSLNSRQRLEIPWSGSENTDKLLKYAWNIKPVEGQDDLVSCSMPKDDMLEILRVAKTKNPELYDTLVKSIKQQYGQSE